MRMLYKIHQLAIFVSLCAIGQQTNQTIAGRRPLRRLLRHLRAVAPVPLRVRFESDIYLSIIPFRNLSERIPIFTTPIILFSALS